MLLHPRKNDQGQPVKLLKPSVPTDPATWRDATALARVVPAGPLPCTLNGLALAPWREAPGNIPAWEALASTMPVDEPPFDAPQGFKKAAGVVVREPDGRIWLVAPSNAFGGYEATFPKGGMDGKSAKATALVEALEETGLQVRLTGFLVDALRSSSYTRYFLAERVGGTPAEMGWESQAVMLVPASQLAQVASNARDAPVIAALLGR